MGNLIITMASMDMEMEGHLEEQSNSTSTTTMEDLPSSGPHRKLPAELNREIYLCFKPAAQRKFICGLGWDFYAMFRPKLLTKTKRVCNQARNGWNSTTTEAIISRDDLHASSTRSRMNIYAEKGFAISGKHSRVDSFPGTIIYYYEVKLILLSKSWSMIGLSKGTRKDEWIGDYPNSYAIPTGYNFCRLAGETHFFELPDGTIQSPEPKVKGTNVYGCGLLMDPNDKLAIFFTLNGILIGRQIQISRSKGNYLFPAVTLMSNITSIEANFGNDKDKPFKYDVKKCPGMGLDCI